MAEPQPSPAEFSAAVQKAIHQIEQLMQTPGEDQKLVEKFHDIDRIADAQQRTQARLELIREVRTHARATRELIERQRERFQAPPELAEAATAEERLQQEAAKQALADKLRSEAEAARRNAHDLTPVADDKQQKRKRRWMQV